MLGGLATAGCNTCQELLCCCCPPCRLQRQPWPYRHDQQPGSMELQQHSQRRRLHSRLCKRLHGDSVLNLLAWKLDCSNRQLQRKQ